MPHTVSLAYRPPLRHYATRVPVWRRLLGLADATVEQLMQLWWELFQDGHEQVHEDALTTALGVHLLEGRSYIAAQWEQAVERPARRLLPLLAHELVDDAGELQAAALAAIVHQDVPYVRHTRDTEQWVEQYVGTEVRDITQTSLLAVQFVLRAGLQSGQSLRTVARQARQVLGLTPHQQHSMDTLRQRLTALGMPARAVQQQVAQATRQAIQQRARVIAQHEALTLVHQGAHRAVVQAVQRGIMAPEQVRRRWVITAGACAAICIPIRGMNPPEGVGLYEAFETPAGPMLYPPAHINCRCGIVTNVIGRR